MIHGIASSERIVDASSARDGSDNKVLVARGCELTVPIPLLYHHDSPIGEITHLSWMGTKLYCRAVVFYNAAGRRAWEMIKEHQLRGLSCGTTQSHYEIKIKEKEGVVKYYDQYKIKEISVVQSPLNKDCYFRIYSGGCEGRIPGQRSLSEIRRIHDRARVLLARLDEKYPSKAENENSGKQGLSAVERQRFDAWYKRSLADANLKKEKETDT
jgi:hypothetical protein